MDHVREQLFSRGGRTIRGLSREFKIMDDYDGNRKIVRTRTTHPWCVHCWSKKPYPVYVPVRHSTPTRAPFIFTSGSFASRSFALASSRVLTDHASPLTMLPHISLLCAPQSSPVAPVCQDLGEFKTGMADFGVKLHGGEWDLCFKMFDADGSGGITLDEFLKAIRGALNANRRCVRRKRGSEGERGSEGVGEERRERKERESG